MAIFTSFFNRLQIYQSHGEIMISCLWLNNRDIIKAVQQNQENIETLARDLCVSLAQTYIGSLLLGNLIFY